MTLRANHYRVVQLFNEDGTPIIHAGREVWATRCGMEFLGQRTDSLPANMHPVTFLETHRKTVGSRPVGAPSPDFGEIGTPPPPQPIGGGLIIQGGAGGFSEPEGGGGGPGTAGIGGGRRILVSEDREVWVSRPCTRTPGPPLGPFPLGAHVAAPLKVQHSGRDVYADGCNECLEPPPDLVCCPGVDLPTLRVTITPNGPGCECAATSYLLSRFDAFNWTTNFAPLLCGSSGNRRLSTLLCDVPSNIWEFEWAILSVPLPNTQGWRIRGRAFHSPPHGPIGFSCFFTTYPGLGFTARCQPFFIQFLGLQVLRQRYDFIGNCIENGSACVGLVDVTITLP